MIRVRRMILQFAVLAAVVAAAAITPDSARAGAGDQFPAAPVLNQGKKWRCAYYEGGAYPDYQIIFLATVAGLIKRGWVEPMEFPEYTKDHGEFWRKFSASVKSDYIEFVADAFYSSDFKDDIRPKTRAAFHRRLQEKKDIDFIFAMGTWAGQDLAVKEVQVPTIVASTSNPIAAKIIASAEDSGWDHIHATVDPDRYERQVRLFHGMVNFKKLGVVFENSPEGRTFSAIDEVEKVARELNFHVISCEAKFSNTSKKAAEKEVVDCYTRIAPQVDAVYITVHRGVTLRNLDDIIKPLTEHKLPTFSMKGSDEVQHGALMSISQANFKYVGEFHAEVMGKILNGAKPREIGQVWKAPPKIALNLKTAQLIGFDPPVDIMMASDEIYETIAVAEKSQEQ